MENYYTVEPEVAGGWGDQTEVIRALGQPDVIGKFHYEFDGWLGDDLLESTPCFIVTENLAKAILESQLSGVQFHDVKVSKSSQFEELYPDRDLPNFLWMKPIGRPSQDDFSLTSDLQLLISARALSVLRRFNISHASVDPLGAD